MTIPGSRRVGVFSTDINEEFGNLDGGWFCFGSLACDLSELTDLDTFHLRADYLYNDPESRDSATAPYAHSLAASVHLGKSTVEWVNEVIYVTGSISEVHGVTSLLSYTLTENEKWQAVMRYQYAHGDDDGLILQKRYERQAPKLSDGGSGEDYHAVYAGLNYYIYGHKLKLMAGVEWATMDGGDDGGSYDGWTSFAGFRFYF